MKLQIDIDVSTVQEALAALDDVQAQLDDGTTRDNVIVGDANVGVFELLEAA
jgi:hypothetical protein